MKPCPYIELKYNRKGTWATKAGTLCALPEGHGGLHLMQSGREMRKWARRREVYSWDEQAIVTVYA